MDVDWRGVHALAVGLGEAGESVLPLARVVVRKAAADIKRDAQVFAPVDTGFLRSSISVTVHEEPSRVWAEIGPTAEYGAHVEYGTSRMAPRAYMGPALDRNGPLFVAAVGQIARKATGG